MGRSNEDTLKIFETCPFKDRTDGFCAYCLLRSKGGNFKKPKGKPHKHEFVSHEVLPHEDQDGRSASLARRKNWQPR